MKQVLYIYTYHSKWQGSLKVNPSILVGSFLVKILSYSLWTRNGHRSHIFFLFRMCHNYNNLQTIVACLSHNVEYWPLVIFVQTHPSTLPQPQATFSNKALTLSKRLIFWETLLLVLEMKTYHFENTRKNFCSSVAATAFGYNWHVRATNMAHDTPPRKPNTLE